MTMKRMIFAACVLLMVTTIDAQSETVWKTLAMVDVKSEFNVEYGYEVQTISVNPIVHALENKVIEVEGFMVPLSGKIEQSHFMLSSLPINMCFFAVRQGPRQRCKYLCLVVKSYLFQITRLK